MSMFDNVPLWVVFVVTVALIVTALRVGHRLGKREHARRGTKPEAASAMVGATMGLLAFMLAFTFNNAAGRYETRRLLVVEDANAIERTWLRAAFFEPPQRVEMRRMLQEYVDLRLQAAGNHMDLKLALAKSDSLHDHMWEFASDLAQKSPGSIMAGLFVEALNEMMDTQLKRVTIGRRIRVPGTIWVALYALTVVGMLMMGIQTGLGGGIRHNGSGLALALALSIVLYLIADLDRPGQGLVKVSQQAMTELQGKLAHHP
jgi:hypothetical protein